MKKFDCDCGQVTELVEINGVLCYNEQKHGNNSPAHAKCFNCGKENAELVKETKAAAAKADADAEKARKAADAKAIADAKAAAKNGQNSGKKNGQNSGQNENGQPAANQ